MGEEKWEKNKEGRTDWLPGVGEIRPLDGEKGPERSRRDRVMAKTDYMRVDLAQIANRMDLDSSGQVSRSYTDEKEGSDKECGSRWETMVKE